MTKGKRIYCIAVTLLFCLCQVWVVAVYGQDRPRAALKRGQRGEAADSVRTVNKLELQADSLQMPPLHRPGMHEDERDSLAVADSIVAENERKMSEMDSAPSLSGEAAVLEDSIQLQEVVNQRVWMPNPTKATWLALVIPGAGQIYNRKYWKLPIFYGGFAGCAYALTWNGKMYKDYSTAYRDAANGNWDSSSIQDLLPSGYLNRVSTTQLTEVLRRRKDSYRRYRDLSIFAFIGVYLLSVIDAYVDAELSNFDISPDLSMRVQPAVLDNQTYTSSNGKAVGLQCSFRF